MLVAPARRSRLIARLRSVAIARAVEDVARSWWRSSSKAQSRTQCSLFSMPQWPRTYPAKRAGPALSGVRLVNP